ncbi:MAG: hypothetical protein CL703_02945 [Chloroflexi bacterium]|nr:hypothetical protein [Chloroflexota bacterium]
MNQHFFKAKISSKKIINGDLCLIKLSVDGWKGHTPGQYMEICLTAQNDYKAYRPYSIASKPNNKYVEILIERIPEGEVSTYFYDISDIGDELLVSKPLGQFFILPVIDKNVILIAGGSGIAPFMSMIKNRYSNNKFQLTLFHWSKNFSGLIDYDVLTKQNQKINYYPYITQEVPDNWSKGTGRINKKTFEKLDKNLYHKIFICGSDSFVENVNGIIKETFPHREILNERFGDI